MNKIISRQLTAFLILTAGLQMLGSVALQAQDSAKVVTAAQPQALAAEDFQKIAQSSDRKEWVKIQAFTDDQLKSIINSKAIKFSLGAVQEEYQGLWLNGLTVLTDEQSKLLVKNEGNLALDGLKSLTDEQAKNLSLYRGKYMPRAYQNDPNYQKKYGMRALGVLSLNGIATLSDEQAKWLGKGKCFEIDLNGLTALTDLQAKGFGYFGGAILQLNSLKTLSDKQAKGLAQFAGKISMLSLDQPSKDLLLKYGGTLWGEQ